MTPDRVEGFQYTREDGGRLSGLKSRTGSEERPRAGVGDEQDPTTGRDLDVGVPVSPGAGGPGVVHDPKY